MSNNHFQSSLSKKDDVNLTQLVRTKLIRGYAFSGAIHNGSFFHTSLEVFSDGLIYCWEMVDLPMFNGKLASGWVVTSVPDGEPLHIHGIGVICFSDAKWTHTPDSLTGFIESLISDLNPRAENLHDCHGRDTEEVNGMRYAAVSHGNPRPWKPDGPISPLLSGEYGKEITHFRVANGELHLVRASLFQDDTVRISGLPDGESVTSFGEFREQLRDSTIFRLPEKGDRVVIDQLGALTVKDWQWRVSPTELEAEIHDEHQQALGRPGAIRKCMKAHQAYLTNQTTATLDELRRAYEAVPEHLRMYCGDMDTKDIPIRMILYGEEAIKQWSHYQVAEAEGMTLPTIEVPPPPDS